MEFINISSLLMGFIHIFWHKKPFDNIKYLKMKTENEFKKP